jgi:hypothetical protein
VKYNPGDLLWPLTFQERNIAEGVDQIEPEDIASYAYPEGEQQRYKDSGWRKAWRRGFAIIRLDRITVDPTLAWHDTGCVKRYGAVGDGDNQCQCERRAAKRQESQEKAR